MPNPENIAGQGFHTNPERIHSGRKPGSRNRSTLLRELLEVKSPTNPEQQYIHDVVGALINKAVAGDVPAIKEVLDSMYGKNPDVIAGDPDNPLNTALNISFVGKKDE